MALASGPRDVSGNQFGPPILVREMQKIPRGWLMAKRFDLSWKVVASNPSADLEVCIEEHSNQHIKVDLGNFVPVRDFQCNRVSCR